IAAARERFYRGDVAAMIGAFSERVGGLLRASDLAGYRATLEPPLRTTFAGREILGQGAWTQGPVLMQSLGLLARPALAAPPATPPPAHTPRGGAAAPPPSPARAAPRGAPPAPGPVLPAPGGARGRAAPTRGAGAAPASPPPGDPRGRTSTSPVD